MFKNIESLFFFKYLFIWKIALENERWGEPGKQKEQRGRDGTPASCSQLCSPAAWCTEPEWSAARLPWCLLARQGSGRATGPAALWGGF